MSTKFSLPSLIFHPAYLALTKFIQVSGYKIARSSVRNSLNTIKGSFDLSKLNELLTNFFTDLLVLKIESEVEDLNHIITPCFLLRTDNNNFSIYVVQKIEGDNILVLGENNKEYNMVSVDFKNLLKGAIIILKEEETYVPSPKLLKAYNEEKEADKNYQNNIKVVDAFLSPEECVKIIEFSEDNNLYERSKTGSVDGAKVSVYRTSSSAKLENYKESPITIQLKKKVVNYLKCDINKIEKLQTVRYYKNEEFRPHFDASPTLAPRKLTCLIYLNDGFSGGGTYFPELNLEVTPKTGRLLVFENLDANNEIITQSFHQGFPINNGVKYACNIWLNT